MSNHQLNLNLQETLPKEQNFMETATDTLLKVESLHFSYEDKEVLSNFSFELQKGEILGFLGPNGAGKTTLFHILTGFLPMQKGVIYLNDNQVDPLDPHFRRFLGVIFQQPSLDKKLSALENLLLQAKLYRVPRSTAKTRALELLEYMDLSDRKNDRIEKFSGGMKRRLEIVRALISNPHWILADEPTSGLDESAFRQVWSRLHRLRQASHLSLLLTTHRADEAEQCDRLIILDQGRLLQVGTPEELKSKIRGDILVIETHPVESIQKELEEKLSIPIQALEGRLWMEVQKGHEMIPKIIEAFPSGTFQSISIKKPTLADVFLHLTGKTLEQDVEESP